MRGHLTLFALFTIFASFRDRASIHQQLLPLEQKGTQCSKTAICKYDYQSFATVVEILAFKCSSMNILEVGAGTGSATSSILSKLASGGESGTDAPKFGECWYTDISPGFLEVAKNKFGNHAGRMKYKAFDIEQNPTLQGFEGRHFDLVIASGVLHATTNVEKALKNLETLIRPEGRIAILESTNPRSLIMGFCFGLLPGWWLSEEEERQQGPLLTESSWDAKLRSTGFTGIESAVRHHGEEDRLNASLMLSTTKRHFTTMAGRKTVTLVVHPKSLYQQNLFQPINQEMVSLTDCGVDCIQLQQLGELILDNTLVIALIDCDLSATSVFDASRWLALKRLTHELIECGWVSRQPCVQTDGPIAEIMTGLSRSIRSDNTNQNFRTFTFSESSSVTDIARKIARVAMESLASALGCDCEYRDIDRVLCTNRIAEASAINEYLAPREISMMAQHASLASYSDRSFNLKIKSPGLLDTLYFEEEPRASWTLSGH